jgi:hypothetical protein
MEIRLMAEHPSTPWHVVVVMSPLDQGVMRKLRAQVRMAMSICALAHLPLKLPV